MRFRGIDNTGDWYFGRGKGDYVTQNEEIGLNIKTRILSWVGDCFFDRTAGIDWVNRLGSKGQKSLLAADLRRIILTSKGVKSLKSFDIVYNEKIRTFSASYSVITEYSSEFKDTIEIGVK